MVRRRPTVALPASFDPQLALLAKVPPDGDGWVHEIKFDGYRIGARLDRGAVTLLSRNGKDWTASFPSVAAAVARLPARQALLDGEVAAVLPDGRTSFQALQRWFAGDAATPLVYYVFDLLHLDGDDVAHAPLEERKTRLAALVESAEKETVLRYSAHVAGGGSVFLAAACERNLEGIVSKQRRAPYEPGRRGGWIKTKCVQRQELVIGGFTEPAGTRAGLGALLVGVHDPDGTLRFAGKVGTGFTVRGAEELRAQLDGLERPTPPFRDPPREWRRWRTHWVEPKLVGEVAFTEWTEDGRLRHPSFQGLRADKSARDVVREQPGTALQKPKAVRKKAAATTAGGVEIAGIRLSHPERLLYPDDGITKLDVARYYEDVAEWIVPHVAGRPLTLVRCPNGLDSCFYMKHTRTWSPPAVLRQVKIREQKKVGEYAVADSIAGVVALAQMNVLEIHTWNATVDRLEQPDRIIIDLDPGPEVRWPDVVATAHLVRAALDALGLASFVKTTGGKGVHVVAPFVRQHDWDTCLAFARGVAEAVVREAPARYTTALPKRGRERKILLDYLRNNRGSTAVAAFSTRARPRCPISVPIAWEELTPRLRPDQFHLGNVRQRLRRLGKDDPWRDYWGSRQKLKVHALAAVGARP